MNKGKKYGKFLKKIVFIKYLISPLNTKQLSNERKPCENICMCIKKNHYGIHTTVVLHNDKHENIEDEFLLVYTRKAMDQIDHIDP
jgi:hypothetical protein